MMKVRQRHPYSANILHIFMNIIITSGTKDRHSSHNTDSSLTKHKTFWYRQWSNRRESSPHWMNICYRFWKIIAPIDSVPLKLSTFTRNHRTGKRTRKFQYLSNSNIKMQDSGVSLKRMKRAISR